MATTSELTLRIGADPTKLKTGLKQSSAAIDSFGSKAKASIARVGASMRGLADRMVTPFTSLVLGGGMGMAIKNVGDLSEALMYYGFAAKKSDADTKVFRESLHKTAVETGVAANEILNGVSKIGEITGDFDFAEKMSVSLAKASKASKTSIEDLAAVASSMKGSMGYSADQVLNAFNALIIQGEKGSFTLQSFAAEGKALLASASTFGIKSTDQFAKFGSFLQIVNEKIKSSAETTTSVSALFSELIDKAADIKKKFGVRVFDKNNELREFDVIIKEIMAKTGGSLKKLSPVFGASSMKAINPLIGEFQNNWERMDDIAKAGIEGMKNSDVLEDYYQKASNSFNSNVDKMKNVALEFADTQLTGPVEKLTDALKYLSKHQGIVTAGFQAMKVAALALAAVKVGGFVKSIGGLASDIKGIWSGKKGGNTASSSPLDAVQKVYVVNMGGGMGSSNYMDDDDPGYRGSQATARKETIQNAKEMGRFRSAMTSARSGLNKFGSSFWGGSIMTAATVWATGQIEKFGQAFIEWRNVVADAEANSKRMLDENQKNFTEKYGKETGHWGQKYDDTLLAIQKEENSFLPSQKKLDRLNGELNRYHQLMINSIEAKKGENGMSAEEYMQNMTVAPNIVINMDPWNNRYTAQSDGGKPAKVKLRNTPSMG